MILYVIFCRKLNSLNNNLYGGLPVLAAHNGKVSFNTGILAQNGRAPIQNVIYTTAIVEPSAVYVYANAPPMQYATVESRNADQAYSKY